MNLTDEQLERLIRLRASRMKAAQADGRGMPARPPPRGRPRRVDFRGFPDRASCLAPSLARPPPCSWCFSSPARRGNRGWLGPHAHLPG